MIEDAVLDQLRTALHTTDARVQLNVSEDDWQSFETRTGELVRELVKEVSYDATTGAVSLHLEKSEARHED
jgi:hypothetical protein